MNSKIINGFKLEKGCKYRITFAGKEVVRKVIGIVGTGIFFEDEKSHCYPYTHVAMWIMEERISLDKESKVKKLLNAIDRG